MSGELEPLTTSYLFVVPFTGEYVELDKPVEKSRPRWRRCAG